MGRGLAAEITNPDLGPLPVIEDLAIGTLIVGLIWWFARLRNKPDPEGAAVGRAGGTRVTHGPAGRATG